MANNKNLDTRIKDLLTEGPLVALYFVAGINTLKEQFEGMNDEEVSKMFSRLIHPERVRNNVEYIFNILNNIPVNKDEG